MKNSKLRKVLLLACSAVLLVCLSVGATLAYLTSQDTVTNTFTVGKVKITLDETLTTPDGKPAKYVKEEGAEGEVTTSIVPVGEDETPDRVNANEYHLMPGHTYTKDPTVTVLADTEPCYIRIRMTITNYDKLVQALADCNARKAEGETMLTVDDVIDIDTVTWKLQADRSDVDAGVFEYWLNYVYNGKDFGYEYPGAPDADEPLPELFEEINVPGEFTDKEIELINGLKIVIVAEAIQADGFNGNAADAWAAFPTK